MRFCDIIGHEYEKQRLREMIDNGKLPHALLLHGDIGIGKLMLARAAVQYLHCTNRRPEGDSCGMCNNCRQMMSDNHADTYFVYPVYKGSKSTVSSNDYFDKWKTFIAEYPFASYEQWLNLLKCGNSQPMIYASESAEIIHRMNMAPLSAKCKVTVIWLPEKMNEECSNKLLKIIEEPVSDTYFILVSNNYKAILPTITSRTQPLEIRRLSPEQMAQYLVSTLHIDEDTADATAAMADGNMNLALSSLMADSEINDFFELFVSLMRNSYSFNAEALSKFTEKLTNSKDGFGREKLVRFLRYVSRMMRESYVYNLKVTKLTHMTPQEKAFCGKFAPFINDRNVTRLSSEIDFAIRDILGNCNTKIVIFDLALNIASLLRM